MTPESFAVNLKVGVIKSVEVHSNADRLYVLKVDIGEKKERQVVAGLKKYYSKSDLINKKIVVAVNIKSANIRGVESKGMLLAAEKKQIQRVVVTLAVTAFLTFLLAWNFALPRVAPYLISQQIGKTIAENDDSDETKIGHFGYFRPSLVFYIGQPLIECRNQEDVKIFLAGDGNRILIAAQDQYQAMAPELAANFEVLQQLKRFPEKGNIGLRRKRENSTPNVPAMVEREDHSARR